MTHTHTAKEVLRELRVDLHLKVQVWGLDVESKAFTVMAETVEISAFGARLKDVPPVHEGEILGLKYLDQKARFRVIWVGKPGTEKAEQIGVQCLDESKCLWQAALESGAKETAQAAAAPASATERRGSATAGKAVAPAGKSTAAIQPGDPRLQIAPRESERRRYPRYPTNVEIELKKSGADQVSRLKMSDISLGGCYAETSLPLPVDTTVEMVLKVGPVSIPVKGVVRTSHTAMGMGVGFTHMEPEQWKELAHLIHELSGGTKEIVSVPAKKMERDATVEAALGMMLRLLEEKGVISRDALIEQLKKSH